jgi:hypothetical protein
MTSAKEVILKKYLQNQTCGSIFRDVSKLNVKLNFVYQTINRYIDTGSSGRSKFTIQERSITIRRPVVKKIRERIRQKCDISARKLAADLKLNRESDGWCRKMIYSFQITRKQNHGLTSATVKKRFKRANILLSWHAGDEIFFSD